MGSIAFNQPGAINGTLFLAGNAVHEIWNISDPLAPVRMSSLSSPHKNGEAESHQISFSRFEDGSLHAVTISGRGIDLWNISDPSSPILESALELQGIDYGDFTEAVWGVFWQGHYIFVGGTNTGLHVVDATDPTAPRVVRRIGNTSLGGVSAGPLFALGNLLILTTPKENGGVATIDIGAPDDPVLLDAVLTGNSYSGGFFGSHAHLLSPFRSYDVLTDPKNIRLAGSAETPRTEYISFADSHAFIGSLRTLAGGVTGVLEYDLSDLNALTEVAHVRGRDIFSDDQFSIAVGNLLVVADDERGYGAYLAVRQTALDTQGPEVIAVHPADGAIDQPPSTRIGISFNDVVELTSADLTSVEVRSAAGGEAIAGRFGLAGTVLSFSPSAPLEPNTTYEIHLPAGGIKDFVGNASSASFRSTFTTRTADANRLPCAIVQPVPVATGASARFAAASPDESAYSYHWDFGDAGTANGAAVSATFATPGRRSIALTVVEKPTASTRYDLYEAEDQILAGGVSTRDENTGYSGAGYADFPLFGGGPEISFSGVRAVRSGAHELLIRFANGDNNVRRLRLIVNGVDTGALEFMPLGAWTAWSNLPAAVDLSRGMNTIILRADGNIQAPNIDKVEVSLLRENTCAATQIVHRPIPGGPFATKSSGVIVAGGRAWSVNPDQGSISSVNLDGSILEREISLGGRPRTLALAPDGMIWVAVAAPDSIAVVDPADGRIAGAIALPAGSAPYGIAFAPDGARAFVTLEGLGRLSIFDPRSRTELASVELHAPVRGIAVARDSARVYVSRFISPASFAEVYEIDAARAALIATIELGASTRPDTPDEGRGVPNYLGAPAINPDGTELWVPSKQDNTQRGAMRDGMALTHDATVRPIVSRIELGFGPARETIARREDLNDACMPFAIEFSPLGDLIFIALQGSNKIEVRETHTGRIAGSFSAGAAPEALVLDGDRLYVQNFLDRSLSIADVGAFLNATDNVATVLATVRSIGEEKLAPEILAGKKLFYDASDSRLAKEGYISCAACHLDGREDGRVWDFGDRGEGLRNTISLEGRAGLAHGNVHWTANFDEIQDFENDIRGAFGGTGLMRDEDFFSGTRSDALGDPKAGLSAELDALAAYVTSLAEFPKSPHRAADGSLTSEGARGRQLFFDSGCDTCHAQPHFTDLKTHDVGTLKPTSGTRRGEPLAGIDTPTLIGAFATPPYFHDGSAATFEAVLENSVHAGAVLSADVRASLAAYLKQLDAREVGDAPADPLDPVDPLDPLDPVDPVTAAQPDTASCACSSSQRAPSSPRALLFAAALGLLLLRRRTINIR